MAAASVLAHIAEPCVIAVIEDSPGDARWFELMMEETGLPCSIKTYSHVQTAIRELATFDATRCTAIFIDAILPFLTLTEACQELRSIPSLKGTAIIALVDAAHEVEMAKRAGLERWLWKPVDRHNLQVLLARLIKQPTAS